MANKEFIPVPGLSADDNAWLKKFILDMDLPDENSKAASPAQQPSAVTTPTRTAETTPAVFTAVPPEALQRLVDYQERLVAQMMALNPLSPVPDHITFDSFPVSARVYSEVYGKDKRSLPYESRFAEFTAYRDSTANELAELLGTPVIGRLRIGKHMDSPTMTQYLDFRKTDVLGFDVETVYGIQPDGIMKFAALPWEFGDPRPDYFPNRPEAHHVTSPLIREDIRLMKDTVGYFHYYLGDSTN